MAVLDTWRVRGDEESLVGGPLRGAGQLARPWPASPSASSSSASSPPSWWWRCSPWPSSTSPSRATCPRSCPASSPASPGSTTAPAREMAVFRRFDSSLPGGAGGHPPGAEGRGGGGRGPPLLPAPGRRRPRPDPGPAGRRQLRRVRAGRVHHHPAAGPPGLHRRRSPTLRRKLREAVLARELESQLTKDEILFKYLSRIYLGSGNYGVGAAAESYFRKPVHDLDLSEAALLAGLIPAPSVLDPRINPSGAESQRRRVLDVMADEGMITGQAARPGPGPSPHPGPGGRGRRPGHRPPSSIRPRPRSSKYPYFTDYVRQYLIARFGEETVYTGGLRVETSLDPRLQGHGRGVGHQDPAGHARRAWRWPWCPSTPATGWCGRWSAGGDFAKSNVNLALGNCDAVKPVEPEPGEQVPAVRRAAAAPAASRARPSSPSPWPPPSTPGASPPTSTGARASTPTPTAGARAAPCATPRAAATARSPWPRPPPTP